VPRSIAVKYKPPKFEHRFDVEHMTLGEAIGLLHAGRIKNISRLAMVFATKRVVIKSIEVVDHRTYRVEFYGRNIKIEVDETTPVYTTEIERVRDEW
jgi:hypothetical protein